MGQTQQKAQEEAISVKVSEPELQTSRFVEKGRIIDISRLKQGRRIAVIPFKAGVNVAATDELDRIALNIVKGIADEFSGKTNCPFTLVTAGETENTDFIIEGHVTDVSGPSHIRRWIMLKGGPKRLAVEGRVTSPGTGETIAVFTDMIEETTENHTDLAYQIGSNIGQFVLSVTD